MNQRTFVGQWWLPTAPEEPVGGILTVEPSGKCRLQLTGMLLAHRFLARMQGDTSVEDAGQLIHGSAAGADFTLLGGHDITQEVPMLAPEYPQLLAVQTAIKGVHLVSVDEPRFEGAEVEVDNLTAWSGITGFTSVQNFELDESQRVKDMSVRWELGRPADAGPVGKLGDFRIELAWQSTYSAVTRDMNAARQVAASEEVHAKITNPDLKAWNAFQPAIKSLQDLLTFATRHPCAVRSIHLLLGGSDHGSAELLYAPLVEPQEDTKTEPQRYLFRMPDLSFAELLEKWDSLYIRIGMGIHVLFGLDYEKRGFIENRILNALSAAESIHRALRPAATAIPVDAHKAIMAILNDALATNPYRDRVMGGLGNDPGFVARMKELATIPAQDAVNAVVGNTEQWAKWARDARNAVAHLDGKKFEKIPVAARWGLPSATIGILHLAFLAELGLPENVQVTAARMIYAPWTAEFRAQVDRKVGASA
ncbi:HEPN domain-containing protein [Arthrobacter sp. H-02-3]|uniref:ApeA N-terminal domain 1-containing protein n=1 Tax=Arthrobacter sp. H-02-3 TaxID=2703675 RepID=UPI000DD20EC2|nr:HEPN domain-containing protein [Arthrobacter sp. H-02-3]PVZ52337.1 hypothetical protein C9424_20385 [Arthrobacter sp. H-02-3]